MSADEAEDRDDLSDLVRVRDTFLGFEFQFRLRPETTAAQLAEMTRACCLYPYGEDHFYEIVTHPKGRALPPEQVLPKRQLLFFRIMSPERRKRHMAETRQRATR